MKPVTTLTDQEVQGWRKRAGRTVDISKYFKGPDVDFQIDWPEYFKEFCRLHGDPVQARGRLLFADGWMYSATDYAGPEYPPPEEPDKLLDLRREYWEEALKLRKQMHQQMFRVYEGAENVVNSRSAIVSRVAYREDENGKRRRVAEPIDLVELKEIVESLAADVKTCEQELEELNVGRT